MGTYNQETVHKISFAHVLSCNLLKRHFPRLPSSFSCGHSAEAIFSERKADPGEQEIAPLTPFKSTPSERSFFSQESSSLPHYRLREYPTL